ncbi:hypothetical protein DFA_11105 [Cavenderia fasciculata]|uniref:Uncharacterized protein n=1 Tax=Cavenderia fasciculata TaxID=261658 RepID=F4QET3_CACFS|nr:uncharacterized protein DFA_11105 [Cavenderia fasciculata]EGG13344.1 hypothetical protein DFA_11105 [Cavenderia fasciculata]|eukprot:XP_004350048.1 hypothetical protein DFA_11105 [Cavenderia fasciculata]
MQELSVVIQHYILSKYNTWMECINQSKSIYHVVDKNTYNSEPINQHLPLSLAHVKTCIIDFHIRKGELKYINQDILSMIDKMTSLERVVFRLSISNYKTKDFENRLIDLVESIEWQYINHNHRLDQIKIQAKIELEIYNLPDLGVFDIEIWYAPKPDFKSFEPSLIDTNDPATVPLIQELTHHFQNNKTLTSLTICDSYESDEIPIQMVRNQLAKRSSQMVMDLYRQFVNHSTNKTLRWLDIGLSSSQQDFIDQFKQIPNRNCLIVVYDKDGLKNSHGYIDRDLHSYKDPFIVI